MWWILVPVVFFVGAASGIGVAFLIIAHGHPLPEDAAVDAALAHNLPMGGANVPKDAWLIYRLARGEMQTAVQRFGVSIGARMMLSGIARQLRAEHLSAGMAPNQALAAAQKALVDVVDAMPAEAHYDEPMASERMSPLH